MIEFEDASPSREPPGEIRRRNATGSHQGKEEDPCAARGGRLGRRLLLCGCGTGETRARRRGLSLLDVESVAPLVRWSFVCQFPVSRSVESCCVVPVRRNGVTVEDVADIPAKQLAFNPAGSSGPVDRGLPSATSSLRVRARTVSSYSPFHLHVNEGTSSSSLGTLTGFAMGRRLNVAGSNRLFFLQVVAMVLRGAQIQRRGEARCGCVSAQSLPHDLAHLYGRVRPLTSTDLCYGASLYLDTLWPWTDSYVSWPAIVLCDSRNKMSHHAPAMQTVTRYRTDILCTRSLP